MKIHWSPVALDQAEEALDFIVVIDLSGPATPSPL
jgi:hypothetical protein